jgi:hypothetical protein
MRHPGRARAVWWTLAVCGVLGGLTAWQLARQTPRVVLAGTVGRCAPAIATDHPRACARLDRSPQLFLTGPIDASGTAAGRREIRADAGRRFSLHVRKGRYALCVEIDGLLLAPRGMPGCLLAVQGPRVGLRVEPGPSWTFSGTEAIE